MHSSFEGASYKIIPINEKKKVVILTLPPPVDFCEMYYIGLIAQPEKRFAWVKLPTQRAIGLFQRPKPDFPRGTEIGDLTPRGIFEHNRGGVIKKVKRAGNFHTVCSSRFFDFAS